MKISQVRFREHGLGFLAPHLKCSIPLASLLQVKGRFSSKVGGNRHFLLGPRLNCRTTKIRECSKVMHEGGNSSGALPEDVDIFSELSLKNCILPARNVFQSTRSEKPICSDRYPQ